MKDFKLLKFLDRFKKLFKTIGIDYAIMRKILQLKLTMDGRRSTTIIATYNKNKEKEGTNNFRNSLFWYIFFGGLLSLILLPDMLPVFYSMSVIFGCVMFFITLIMLSDFSTVLLDIRDKNIILSHPVDNKTFNAAKFLHITIYLISIVIAFNCIPLIVTRIGYTMLAFVLTGILAGLHLVATYIKYGTLVYGIVILLILIIRWETLFKITWKEITQ